jgi:hypothetical protein
VEGFRRGGQGRGGKQERMGGRRRSNKGGGEDVARRSPGRGRTKRIEVQLNKRENMELRGSK